MTDRLKQIVASSAVTATATMSGVHFSGEVPRFDPDVIQRDLKANLASTSAALKLVEQVRSITQEELKKEVAI